MVIVILIFIGLVSAIAAFVSATHKMYDPDKKGLKRITKSGYAFFAFASVLIILPVIQKLWKIKGMKLNRKLTIKN